MWAVRYERRCRVFTDMIKASRFFQQCEPITYQSQLLKLLDNGKWEGIAWTNPPTRIKDTEGK